MQDPEVIARLQEAEKVSAVTLIINILLAVAKVIVGFVSKSNAMIADGVHTVSDVVTTVAVMVGMHFSAQPDDKEHPYGHERIESEVAKMLAVVLLVVGAAIGWEGIKTIISGEFIIPGVSAVYAAAFSIISKELMYRYTIKTANKIKSPALKADAWHHRSDALSSVGTLIGIAGARMGFPILDPIAAIIVCIFILQVAIKIYIQAFNQLIDRAADEKTIADIYSAIASVDGVVAIDDLKTRLFGARLYVDVEISVDSKLTISEGHTTAESVHETIESNFKDVKHCMVHVNPNEKPKELN